MARTRSKKARRHHQILNTLAANSGVTVADLSDQLAVSRQTIRRDLDELSGEGFINRTHGGASTPPVGQEPNMAERGTFNMRERALIARCAASLVSENDVLMLGGGLTTSVLAQQLAVSFRHLQILTNSLSIATTMGRSGASRVVLLPGDYDGTEACTVGAETLEFISKFRGDIAFIGGSGIDCDGVYEVHSGLSWVDRAMIAQCPRRVAMLPCEKVGKAYFERICPLDDLDYFITDKAVPASMTRCLDDACVTLLTPGSLQPAQ